LTFDQHSHLDFLKAVIASLEHDPDPEGRVRA
jgi:hypothetical protein